MYMFKKNYCFQFLFLGITMLFFPSCNDTNSEFQDYTDDEYALLSQRLNLPQGLYKYTSTLDEGFFSHHLGNGNIQENRSDHKATLGRVLFYDNMLSINDAVSCASCHKQELGFADDVAFSEGFDGQLTTRNSLPLGNTVGFETSYGNTSSGGGRAFFSWDESNEDLSSQSEAAITNEVEMGMNMSDLITKIRQEDYYKILFEKAYGDNKILEHRSLDALEEFVNSIVSNRSKFDKTVAENFGAINVDFAGFTDQENLGKRLYRVNCSSCHSNDHHFITIATANNGLDLSYDDKGIGGITNDPSDNGVFKIPFLRNIVLSAPYMHDGRFETLEEVIDHYSEGIADHDNLHLNLKEDGVAKKMNFTAEEKEALIAYLNTLTDEALVADIRFSDPFK